MAIFAAGSVQVVTVANTATKIFDTTSAKYATGAYLTDVTIVNTGSTTVFLGSSSVTAATGLPLLAGNQITYNGYKHLKSDTTGDIYAITTSGTSTTEAGLATVDANV